MCVQAKCLIVNNGIPSPILLRHCLARFVLSFTIAHAYQPSHPDSLSEIINRIQKVTLIPISGLQQMAYSLHTLIWLLVSPHFKYQCGYFCSSHVVCAQIVDFTSGRTIPLRSRKYVAVSNQIIFSLYEFCLSSASCSALLRRYPLTLLGAPFDVLTTIWDNPFGRPVLCKVLLDDTGKIYMHGSACIRF
jgi:hypothetical protein